MRKIIVALLIGLLLVVAGCGKKEKLNNEYAELMNEVNESITAFFNEEKSDLAEGVTHEDVDQVAERLEDIDESVLNEENEALFNELHENITLVKDMLNLEKRLDELVEDGLEVDEDEVEIMKNQLSFFSKFPSFVERQEKKIKEAELALEKKAEQVKLVEKVEEELDKLFTEAGDLVDDITEKQYDNVVSLIKKIDDKATKKKLSKEANKIIDRLAVIKKEEEERKRQEELAKKEAEEKKRQEEERKKREQAQANAQTNAGSKAGSSVSSSASSSGGSASGSGSSSGGSSKGGSSSSSKGSSGGGSSSGGNSSGGSSSGGSSSGGSSGSGNSGGSTPKVVAEVPEFASMVVGNSGREFNTSEEAVAWAKSQWLNEDSKWYMHGFEVNDINYIQVDENGVRVPGTPRRKTWTVNFFLGN